MSRDVVGALERWLNGAASDEDRDLIQKAFELEITDWEAQRRSFAYGNTKLSNENVTREMIDESCEK